MTNLKDLSRSLIILCAGLLSILPLSSCTNLFTPLSVQLNVGDTPTFSPTPGLFQITQVNKNTLQPTQILDIVGDGSGQLGTFCAASDQSNPNTTTGTSACECTYQYNSPSQGNGTISQPVIYHESNLVRCNYASSGSSIIPYDVTSFNVLVTLISSSASSNPVQFNFAGSLGLDPTQASSYQKISRYFCNSIITITSLLDKSIYDPIQSVNPYFTYPLDYYTNNMGSSLEYFVNSASEQPTPADECPGPAASSIPIWSVADYGGSMSIDPPSLGASCNPATTVCDRSTFYLATAPTGILSIPVNAAIAPTVVSNGDSQGNFTTAPPLGYGAHNISTGPGAETCPSSTYIPPGYQWVKVWLFRASVPIRSQPAPASLNLASIVCNPGDWQVNSTSGSGSGTVNAPMFGACQDPYSINNANTAHGISDLTQTDYLADRVIITTATTGDPSSQCVQLSTGGSTASATSPNSCTTSATPRLPGVGCGSAGGDFWNLVAPNPAPSSGVTCAAGTRGADPLNLCEGKITSAGGGSNLAQPKITNLTATANFESNNRWDYLFVVTPTTINTSDIVNSTSQGQQFIPQRGYTSADCTSAGVCGDSSKVLTYGPLLNDITVSTDPNANDPQRTGVFPICAIQPKKAP